MNAAQQELVRITFAKLAVMPEVAAALFYERLFETNPGCRSLFKNDMRVQGLKLMSMLDMFVHSSPGMDEVLPAVRELAVRHVKYGVSFDDYDAVREALLWTLEQVLGEDFNPSIQEAWSTCYDQLAGGMKAAAGL